MKLRNDRSVAERELKRKLGTLLYLNNLRAGAGHGLVEEEPAEVAEGSGKVGSGGGGGGGEGASSSSKEEAAVTLVNPEPCSICLNSLGGEWSVLRCGHCFCHDCVGTLLEQKRKRAPPLGGRGSAEAALKNVKIQCALCRESTAFDEIRYVTTKRRRDEKVRRSG